MGKEKEARKGEYGLKRRAMLGEKGEKRRRWPGIQSEREEEELDLLSFSLTCLKRKGEELEAHKKRNETLI